MLRSNNKNQESEACRVIAFIDKTVVKITGVRVAGLSPELLEKNLQEVLKRPVRVIGVTSKSLEMDVYNLESEQIWHDKAGIIRAVAGTSGITAEEVIEIAKADKASTVPFDRLKQGARYSCAKENWVLKQVD